VSRFHYPLKWIIIAVCLIFFGLFLTNEKILSAWDKFWLWS